MPDFKSGIHSSQPELAVKVASSFSRASVQTKSPGAGLSLLFGLAVFTNTPPEGSANFLRMIRFGSYILTYFDFAVMVGALWLLLNANIRIFPHEKKIIRALWFIIASRVLSLVFASSMDLGQVVSVLRYLETLVALVIMAHLLGERRNRQFFLAGVILGTFIETLGGMVILITSSGDMRAVWLGIDNYKWQVYLLWVCVLFVSAGKHVITSILSATALLVGILATQTRAALVLFCILVGISVIKRRRQLMKPVLISFILFGVAILPILKIFPDSSRLLDERLEQLWEGGGVIGYRVILLEMAAAAYLNHPITGIGSGGFARQQNALYLYIPDAFDPEYVTAYGSLSTHNTFFGVAAETGSVGLLAYAFWIIAITKFCLSTLKIKEIDYDYFAMAACLLTLCFLCQDFWGQASFLASSISLLGFVLGWRRSPQLASAQ